MRFSSSIRAGRTCGRRRLERVRGSADSHSAACRRAGSRPLDGRALAPAREADKRSHAATRRRRAGVARLPRFQARNRRRGSAAEIDVEQRAPGAGPRRCRGRPPGRWRSHGARRSSARRRRQAFGGRVVRVPLIRTWPSLDETRGERAGLARTVRTTAICPGAAAPPSCDPAMPHACRLRRIRAAPSGRRAWRRASSGSGAALRPGRTGIGPRAGIGAARRDGRAGGRLEALAPGAVTARTLRAASLAGGVRRSRCSAACGRGRSLPPSRRGSPSRRVRPACPGSTVPPAAGPRGRSAAHWPAAGGVGGARSRRSRAPPRSVRPRLGDGIGEQFRRRFRGDRVGGGLRRLRLRRTAPPARPPQRPLRPARRRRPQVRRPLRPATPRRPDPLPRRAGSSASASAGSASGPVSATAGIVGRLRVGRRRRIRSVGFRSLAPRLPARRSDGAAPRLRCRVGGRSGGPTGVVGAARQSGTVMAGPGRRLGRIAERASGSRRNPRPSSRPARSCRRWRRSRRCRPCPAAASPGVVPGR